MTYYFNVCMYSSILVILIFVYILYIYSNIYIYVYNIHSCILYIMNVYNIHSCIFWYALCILYFYTSFTRTFRTAAHLVV